MHVSIVKSGETNKDDTTLVASRTTKSYNEIYPAITLMAKRTLLPISIASILFFFFSMATPAYAVFSYGSGYYTNLCGTGITATADTCNAGCNPSNGSCSASTNTVVKYICGGKRNECRSNESPFAGSQSFGSVSCGNTVQIDVFSKTCRVGGTWTCAESDLRDYMVWYSGDCQTIATPIPTATAYPTATIAPTVVPTNTPKPTSTPKPTLTPRPTTAPTITPVPTPIHTSSCDELKTVSGNTTTVPASVVLRARASDSSGAVSRYRFFFGDGKQEETTNPEITHIYETSGSFVARVDAKDSRGAWKTGSACETTVTVRSSVIESHKSNCSDLFALEGNDREAPQTVKFLVTGFDNKGTITTYKIDFGLGFTKESNSGSFEQLYATAGTYMVKGYIKDSEGNWKGGEESCRKTVYIRTKPLAVQPATGTPTAYSIGAFISGILGFSVMILRRKLFV